VAALVYSQVRMSQAKTITGRCMCGSVSYSAEADPVVQAVCHCTDCQRQTGSPFTVVVGVPRAALTVQGSTLASFTTVGEDHGGDTERNFCSACGSPLFSVAAVAPELALIKAGSLDDASWLEPAAEFWTSSAQPWSPRFEQAAAFDRGPA
jgi:hypothetical protein